MANQIVLADTSILIDFFRKTDKSKSILFKLIDEGFDTCISVIFDTCISVITEYEIYSGANQTQLSFWDNLLTSTQVLAFDQSAVRAAVEVNNDLKRKRKQIDLADLFIAATAIAHRIPIATLNKKHFERIDNLLIVA